MPVWADVAKCRARLRKPRAPLCISCSPVLFATRKQALAQDSALQYPWSVADSPPWTLASARLQLAFDVAPGAEQAWPSSLLSISYGRQVTSASQRIADLVVESGISDSDLLLAQISHMT